MGKDVTPTNIATTDDPSPVRASSSGHDPVRFLPPGARTWKCLDLGTESSDESGSGSAEKAREELSSILLSSMQTQHLLVLAGCGTSRCVGGPSMEELWNRCTAQTADITKLLERIRYAAKSKNIEEVLSRCDAVLLVDPEDKLVKDFRDQALEQILKACRGPGTGPGDDLKHHREFLRRLARRRARDPRLRLYTTNYDRCFEMAAGLLGLVALDGFSFSQPRRFDPRYFEYDIVRRDTANAEATSYLSGVFQYFKLHGSVDWVSDSSGVAVDPAADAAHACLIYPAHTKYQLSFQQPHLELMAQYLASLRQPNTCLLAVGFGFADAHLAAPIFSALESNPHFRLIVVDPGASERLDSPGGHTGWQRLSAQVKRGADVCLVQSGFERFVDLIPDLRALTPAERLQRAIKDVAETT